MRNIELFLMQDTLHLTGCSHSQLHVKFVTIVVEVMGLPREISALYLPPLPPELFSSMNLIPCWPWGTPSHCSKIGPTNAFHIHTSDQVVVHSSDRSLHSSIRSPHLETCSSTDTSKQDQEHLLSMQHMTRSLQGQKRKLKAMRASVCL